MRIETSAPTRIDLAGGTIDIWPLYLFHAGAQTINAAISIRASAVAEPRADGSIVLTSLVPLARDELARVRVPKGQEALARTVRDALQVVIDRATVLADSIDANRSFSFSYADEFTAAIAAVDDYATTVEGDLAEAQWAPTRSA